MILIHPTVTASPATLQQLMQQTNCTAVAQGSRAVLIPVSSVAQHTVQQGVTA